LKRRRQERRPDSPFILAGQLERLLLDCLANSATANALHANFHRSGSSAWQSGVYLLQIGTKLAARNASDFRTDTPEILRFTASLDRVAHLGAFSANFTRTSHGFKFLQNRFDSVFWKPDNIAEAMGTANGQNGLRSGISLAA
jgi:hypothetical protein